MSDPVVPRAGGFWPFGNPEEIGAKPIGAWAFAARCIEAAQEVLVEDGVYDGKILDQETVRRLEGEVNPESHAAVAISLWAMAANAQRTLSMAERTPSAGLADAVARVFSSLGMTMMQLQSMRHLGVADLAQAAQQSRRGSRRGKEARTRQAQEALLQAYGRRALELAREILDRRPHESRAGVARAIRAHSDSGKPGLRLPATDGPIITFLAKNGAFDRP